MLFGGVGAAVAVHHSQNGVSALRVADALRGHFGVSEPTDRPAAPPGTDARTAELYADRGFQPLWLDPAAHDAARRLLARADRDGLDPAAFDLAVPDPAPRPLGDSAFAAYDLALTDALLRFGDGLAAPLADAAALYGAAWTPTDRGLDAAARLRAALAVEAPDLPAALAAWADGLRPRHAGYRRLRLALDRELTLAERPDLVLAADLAPGDTGRAVLALRERLAVEGAPTPATPRFDAPLQTALAGVQDRLGLTPTGRLDAPTRALFNRRQTDLVPLMRLNLERWRWLPDSLGPLHVTANIPAFEFALFEGEGLAETEVFRSVSVVGLPSWATPVFSDTLETVVFNPTWTMPASIQRESYGRLRPDRAVRPPGPGNALGRVKFLFPNRHAVYIHDTPSKGAFGLDRRARSHGCVRAADPGGFAAALLTRTNGWTAGEVAARMTGPWLTHDVDLERPVPVHLVYFTAEADAAGRVRVYRDVYGHDPELADALGLSLASLPSIGA